MGAFNQHTGARRQVGDQQETDRFTADTAAKTGQSERAIQRDAERGSKISERALSLAAIFAAMAWTIQTLIHDGMRLNAYCQRPGCGYNAWLDLEALKTRLGPDHPAMVDDLAPRHKCSRCGARGIGLSYSPEAAARAGGSDRGRQ